MQLLLSRKTIAYVLGLLAVIVVAAYFACGTAKAADHDAAYYQRTGTKPPAQADVYLGPALNFADQLAPGIKLSVLPKGKPFMFTIDANLVRIDGIDGTTPFVVGCRTYHAPYSVDSRKTGQVAFAMQFRLGKPK